jgi:hypothetical protein
MKFKGLFDVLSCVAANGDMGRVLVINRRLETRRQKNKMALSGSNHGSRPREGFL